MWAALDFSVAAAIRVCRPSVTQVKATVFCRIARTVRQIFSPSLMGTAHFVYWARAVFRVIVIVVTFVSAALNLGVAFAELVFRPSIS